MKVNALPMRRSIKAFASVLPSPGKVHNLCLVAELLRKGNTVLLRRKYVEQVSIVRYKRKRVSDLVLAIWPLLCRYSEDLEPGRYR